MQNAIGLESMKEITGQAKRKKIVIVDNAPLTAKQEL